MSNQLPTDYQAFIALSRYARWLPDENRREDFGETVDRYITNVVNTVVPHSGVGISKDIKDSILDLDQQCN